MLFMCVNDVYLLVVVFDKLKNHKS